MLHSDTLAQEFNEILNGVEIFAPFQPLDPAVTFYAPLRTTVRDLRLNPDRFERASDAWYKDGNGLYRHVGINRPRFEQSRLLMEPALTNKNTNYNARPDVGATNLIVSGAGTLQRVYDPELFDVLGDLTDGWCWELSGFGGSTALEFGGGTGNTNLHTGSAWCKMIAAPNNDPFLRIGTVAPQKSFNNTTWERIVTTEFPDQSRLLRLQCPTDTVARIVMNQLEESPVATSPIVTEGTAGQRAADLMDWDVASSTVDDAQGMAIFDWQPLFGYETVAASILRGLLGMADDIYESLAMQRFLSPGGQSQLTNHDGSGHATVDIDGNTGPEAGIRYKVAALWQADVIRQIGYNRGAGWVWGNPVGVTSGWGTAGILRLARQIDRPHRFGEVEIYNENRGTAWIEANYP